MTSPNYKINRESSILFRTPGYLIMLSRAMTVVPDKNFATNKEKAMVDKKVLKALIVKALDWFIFIGLLSGSIYVMKESINKFIKRASTFEISSEGIHGHVRRRHKTDT